MRICELGSVSTSAIAKGMKHDKRHREQIKAREKARRDSQDVKEFTETMAKLYPEHFE